MAKPILPRQVAFPQDSLESLCDVYYALSAAVELAGQMDNPLKDIAVVCARDMGRILERVEQQAEKTSKGGRR